MREPSIHKNAFLNALDGLHRSLSYKQIRHIMSSSFIRYIQGELNDDSGNPKKQFQNPYNRKRTRNDLNNLQDSDSASEDSSEDWVVLVPDDELLAGKLNKLLLQIDSEKDDAFRKLLALHYMRFIRSMLNDPEICEALFKLKWAECGKYIGEFHKAVFDSTYSKDREDEFNQLRTSLNLKHTVSFEDRAKGRFSKQFTGLNQLRMQVNRANCMSMDTQLNEALAKVEECTATNDILTPDVLKNIYNQLNIFLTENLNYLKNRSKKNKLCEKLEGEFKNLIAKIEELVLFARKCTNARSQIRMKNVLSTHANNIILKNNDCDDKSSPGSGETDPASKFAKIRLVRDKKDLLEFCNHIMPPKFRTVLTKYVNDGRREMVTNQRYQVKDTKGFCTMLMSAVDTLAKIDNQALYDDSIQILLGIIITCLGALRDCFSSFKNKIPLGQTQSQTIKVIVDGAKRAYDLAYGYYIDGRLFKDNWFFSQPEQYNTFVNEIWQYHKSSDNNKPKVSFHDFVRAQIAQYFLRRETFKLNKIRSMVQSTFEEYCKTSYIKHPNPVSKTCFEWIGGLIKDSESTEEVIFLLTACHIALSLQDNTQNSLNFFKSGTHTSLEKLINSIRDQYPELYITTGPIYALHKTVSKNGRDALAHLLEASSGDETKFYVDESDKLFGAVMSIYFFLEMSSVLSNKKLKHPDYGKIVSLRQNIQNSLIAVMSAVPSQKRLLELVTWEKGVFYVMNAQRTTLPVAGSKLDAMLECLKGINSDAYNTLGLSVYKPEEGEKSSVVPKEPGKDDMTVDEEITSSETVGSPQSDSDTDDVTNPKLLLWNTNPDSPGSSPGSSPRSSGSPPRPTNLPPEPPPSSPPNSPR